MASSPHECQPAPAQPLVIHLVLHVGRCLVFSRMPACLSSNSVHNVYECLCMSSTSQPEATSSASYPPVASARPFGTELYASLVLHLLRLGPPAGPSSDNISSVSQCICLTQTLSREHFLHSMLDQSCKMLAVETSSHLWLHYTAAAMILSLQTWKIRGDNLLCNKQKRNVI